MEKSEKNVVFKVIVRNFILFKKEQCFINLILKMSKLKKKVNFYHKRKIT